MGIPEATFLRVRSGRKSVDGEVSCPTRRDLLGDSSEAGEPCSLAPAPLAGPPSVGLSSGSSSIGRGAGCGGDEDLLVSCKVDLEELAIETSSSSTIRPFLTFLRSERGPGLGREAARKTSSFAALPAQLGEFIEVP